MPVRVLVAAGVAASLLVWQREPVEGQARAMRLALDDAGSDAEAIGYINAHGTGTPANDPVETAAIRQVFGSRAASIPVSSTKSMHAHLLGAAGALELVASILAAREAVLPPTMNLQVPDPECDLDYVPEGARKVDLEYALSNSMGLGGHNGCVIVRRYHG